MPLFSLTGWKPMPRTGCLCHELEAYATNWILFHLGFLEDEDGVDKVVVESLRFVDFVPEVVSAMQLELGDFSEQALDLRGRVHSKREFIDQSNLAAGSMNIHGDLEVFDASATTAIDHR